MPNRNKRTSGLGRRRRAIARLKRDGDPEVPRVRTLVLSDTVPSASVGDRLAEAADPGAMAAADRLLRESTFGP